MKLRREYLLAVGVTAVILLISTAGVKAEVEEAERPTVITRSGPVQGIKEKSTLGKDIYSFYGIPYARPPIGKLRLKNPIPVESWEDTLDCSEQPPRCLQLDDPFQRDDSVIGSEDCLYLNIFTPVDLKEEKAVMVFIHGGAYFRGSASEYPPYALLNEDVVLVVIQYRLGMLGFLSTEDSVMPGNYGLKDQTAALKWIQENIGVFGGHSLKITLFGESAGAASIHFQILSPKSLGMFHQAILQSANALCSWSFGAAHREVAKYTGSLFNCSSSPDDDDLTASKKLEQCFEDLDAEEFARTIKKFMVWSFLPILLGPRIDGDFIPKEPESLMQESRFKRIQLMSGITSHDGALHSLAMYASESLRGSIQYNFPNFGPVLLDFGDGDVSPLNMTIKIFDHFVGGLNLDADAADNVTEMLTQRHFGHCHDLTTTLHARTVLPRKSVFRYQFSYRGQHSLSDWFGLDIGKHWVTHGDELFYLFEGGKLWTPLKTEEDLKMRNIMTKLWSNFAIYGHPTTPGQNETSLGLTWDHVTQGDDYGYFDITLDPVMKPDSKRQERDFWLHLPTKQNFILFPEKMKDLKLVPVEEDSKESKPPSEAAADKQKEEDLKNDEPEEVIAEPSKDEDATQHTKKDEL